MTKKIYIAEVIADTRERELIAHRMDELIQLVETYGGFEIVKRVQQRIKPDYKSYIGSGKLEEIRLEMKECGAELLIFGNILKPRQLYYVNEYFREDKLEARDRVDLILNIFSRHASSTEAKLQIELAAIKHMGPRIFGMGDELSNQGAGIGTSGIGETNTEIMRRHLKKRREHIKKDLMQYEQVRKNHRLSRQKRGLPTYGLVGYTNAGKSSLMNSLTNKGVLVQNKLFATLGTDVGEVYFPSMKGKGTMVLINDTIGFIRDLPPSLIDAFRSTLEDSIEANVLMHVIDCTDPLRQDKVQVVDTILDDIGADQERWYVMNKVDKIQEVTSKQVNEKTSLCKDDIGSQVETTACLVQDDLQIPPTPFIKGEMDCSDASIIRPDQTITSDPDILDESQEIASQPYIDKHTSRTLYIHITPDTRDDAEQWLLDRSKTRGYETPDIYRVSAHSGEGMKALKQSIGGPDAWVE